MKLVIPIRLELQAMNRHQEAYQQSQIYDRVSPSLKQLLKSQKMTNDTSVLTKINNCLQNINSKRNFGFKINV